MVSGLVTRLRFWWATRGRGSLATPQMTTGLPIEQHEQLTEAERFRRDHGYSMATAPLQDTVETSAHNRAVEQEYQDEIERRKALMASGAYTPRFYLFDFVDGVPVMTDEVNWHMELTMDPGRRVDVTKAEPALTKPTEDEQEKQRELERMRQQVARAELAPPRTVRDIIGSRESIIATCGSEEAAIQVEASACKAFGVQHVDDPLPRPERV